MTYKLPKMDLGFPGVHPQDMPMLAREAEDAGFYSVSIGDGEGVGDTFVSLSAMAAVTKRVRLISSIATWARTPVTTARACRTINLLSEGRYIFGLGSMPRNWNEDHHGIPGATPIARMREFVELLRILWQATPDEPVNFEGRFYRVVNFRAGEPPPQPHLPIYVGASRPNMFRAAGEWADGILLNWNYTFPWLREVAYPAVAEGAQGGGRTFDDVDVVALRWTYITDDPDEASEARNGVRQILGTYFMGVDYHNELLTTHGFADEVKTSSEAAACGDFEGAARAITDEMVDAFSIIGTAEQCLERVAEFTPLVSTYSLYSLSPKGTREDRIKSVRRLIKTFGHRG